MTVMFFRSFITYILLLLVLRLMGKRQVGELQPSELVTTLLLSEIASQPITDDNIPLVYGIVPAVVVLSFEVILSFLITKSEKMKRIMTGNVSILIDKGNLNVKEMRNARISLEELASELRLKNVTDISDVQYAILEKNGKLSVVLKSQKQALTPSDIKIETAEKGISHALIVDGKINFENIKTSGKSKDFIECQLAKRNINTVEEVMLFTCDDAENITVIKKEE